MLIREYEHSDLESVLSSWETAMRFADPSITDEMIFQEKSNVAELYIPHTETWLAVDEGLVIGFIALIGHEVEAMFLHPDYSDKNVVRALMERAKKAHGELDVFIEKNNELDRDFYIENGFDFCEDTQTEDEESPLLHLKLESHQTSLIPASERSENKKPSHFFEMPKYFFNSISEKMSEFSRNLGVVLVIR